MNAINCASLVLITLSLTSCASFEKDPSRVNLNELRDCAEKRANELDNACFKKHSDHIYEGTVVEVIGEYGVDIKVDLGHRYTVYCQNNKDADFRDLAKTLRRGDRVTVRGEHTDIVRSYGAISSHLNPCYLGKVAASPTPKTGQASPTTHQGLE